MSFLCLFTQSVHLLDFKNILSNGSTSGLIVIKRGRFIYFDWPIEVSPTRGCVNQ